MGWQPQLTSAIRATFAAVVQRHERNTVAPPAITAKGGRSSQDRALLDASLRSMGLRLPRSARLALRGTFAQQTLGLPLQKWPLVMLGTFALVVQQRLRQSPMRWVATNAGQERTARLGLC